jgi:N-acetylmuramoyl-L-alanine amidase
VTAAPPIVSRSAWGANPLKTPAGTIPTPSRDLWLHHTASTGLHGASGMRSLQANAIAGGYADLEYNWVVDTDGTIYESRGPGRNSAATGSNNDTSHAICVMGNFETVDTPSEHLLDVLGQLVAWAHASGWTPGQITGPHKDAPNNATACCGSSLIARIPDINARAAGGKGPPPAPEPAEGNDDMQILEVTNPKRANNQQPYAFIDTAARKVWSYWGFKITWDGGGVSTLHGESDPYWIGIPGSAPILGWAELERSDDGTSRRICAYGKQGAQYTGTAHT